jgi:2-keto-3-deoxy-L-fuconate dehydrogenase
MRLTGKTAIVTGAGSGIGRATALLFAAEGAKVVLVDRDADGVAATLDAIQSASGIARATACDVTDEAAAQACVAQTVADWGALDVLVTAAGISTGKQAHETSLADFQAVFAVNVTGTFLWLRESLGPMLAQGRGSIVTVASQLARAGGRNNAAYVASKGAILSLTHTVAVDYAERGVRCNALLPGAIDTAMLRRSFARAADPNAAAERSRLRHPMARFGQADEIAHGALYLASDAASFVTGIELPIDGGWLAG